MYETYLLSRHTTLRISRVSNAILISAYLVEGAILQRLFEWLTERLNFRRQWKKRQSRVEFPQKQNAEKRRI